MMIGLIQNQHYIPILVQQILLKMLVNSLFHRQQIWNSLLFLNFSVQMKLILL